MHRTLLCLAFVALTSGCGPDGPAKNNPLLLAEEPAGAVGVIEARKEAKDGDEVVVAGTVGGDEKPFTEGRASFLMVDPSLKPGECDCPWDFCESDGLEQARMLVKFVDGKGNTLKAGAKEMFGIKELSRVVVKGKLKRDDRGNVAVLATGLFVRPEAK